MQSQEQLPISSGGSGTHSSQVSSALGSRSTPTKRSKVITLPALEYFTSNENMN